MAYGVVSSRREHRDQPPPPPAPRPHVPPEPSTQRDSSSLLDLEVKRPEELHLRFEPVVGIAPSRLAGAEPPTRMGVPDPSARIGVTDPRARIMPPPDPRARRTTPAGMPPAPTAAQPTLAEHAVPAGAHVTPRLTLREREVEDNSPTTKFATAPVPSGMKARYWIYGLAVGLGAAGLVAAGYSAALVQLTSRDDRAAAPQTSTAAATDVRPPAAPAASSPNRIEPQQPMAAAEPSEPADEPASVNGARGRSNSSAKNHMTRTRNAPTSASEPSSPSSDTSAPEPLAAAAHVDPDPAPAGTSTANAPAPRLIITPLPDLPEPAAPEPSSAAVSSTQDTAPEPPASKPSSEPAPAPAPESSTPAAPQENLPAQLSRDDVQQQLLNMRDKLAACAGTQHGTSYANVTINGNGRVSYSTIDGAFAGTPAGSCMARTLRSASFARFSGPQMTVRYPYVF